MATDPGPRRVERRSKGDQPRLAVAPLSAPSPGPRVAYRVLHVAFSVLPIVTGLDKFFHLLVNWNQYLAPFVARILGGGASVFMHAAGVIEIIAGIGVALRPRVFGFVVSLWLIGIVFNLLLTGHYFDIALRDFGLALSAFSLGFLSLSYGGRRAESSPDAR